MAKPRLTRLQMKAALQKLRIEKPATCRACQDKFLLSNRHKAHQEAGVPLQDGELDYCQCCANELYRGQISVRPARLYSVGAGGGHGGPSPLFENCVRALEDNR